MELPIDHFRLLGVSPSAIEENVLRTLQLRLDRSPQEGFTHEVLIQRAELLQLSADLLTDKTLREKYEAALLAGAAGLELSLNREVAGLILLWEADAPLEAFRLACKALHPPQAPALGSGREADLTLVASLACKDAALQEQEQRHYQSAAILLQEGIQLLQRIGKLPEERKKLEQILDELIPYRILDLLSRDLGEQNYHQEGIHLLDSFVRSRGGLEGKLKSKTGKNISQNEFELFFQQIRKFLTVQEQIDLFTSWQRNGSIDAGFLAVLALIANGFSRRKPESIKEAKKYINSLNLNEIDPSPIIGCMDLLLADINRAKKNFLECEDKSLKAWIENYPGDILAALCDYCIDWLKKDVLQGYRDIEIKNIDLEEWFRDKDVQQYIERMDKKGAFELAKGSFKFITSNISSDSSNIDNSIEFEKELESGQEKVLNQKPQNIKVSKRLGETIFIKNLSNIFQNSYRFFKEDTKINPFKNINKPNKNKFPIKGSLLVATAIVIGLTSVISTKQSQDGEPTLNQTSKESIAKEKEEISTNNKQGKVEEDFIPELKSIKPLNVESPSESQILNLLESWLNGKALILSGEDYDLLGISAREQLVERVKEERKKDISVGNTQLIEAKISSIKLISQTKKRIEVKTSILYKEQRLDSSGQSISETYIPNLTVTYILGRQSEIWQLVDYISGN